MTTRAMLIKKYLTSLAAVATLTMSSAAFAGIQDTNTYRAFTSSQGTLSLIDPVNPSATPIVIAEGEFLGDMFRSGLISGANVANDQITDFHNRHLVFVNNRKLYRASLVKASPRSVLQITSDAEVCAVDTTYSDFAVPGNSSIVFESAGPDSLCDTSDDVKRFTTLLANSSRAPIDLGGYNVEAPLYRETDGALLGYLVRNGKDVRRVGVTFSLPGAALLTLAAADSELVIGSRFGGSFLYLQGALDSDPNKKPHLLRYDTRNSRLADLYAFANAPGDTLQVDANYAYFTDGLRVKRIGHTGVSAGLLTMYSGVEAISLRAQTPTRLVVVTSKPSSNPFILSNSVRSLLKVGGSLKTLQPDGQPVIGPITAGNRVYFSLINLSTFAYTAKVIVDDASTLRIHANGFWSPVQLATSFSNTAGADFAGILKVQLMQPLADGSVRVSLNDPLSATLSSTLIATFANSSIASLIGFGRYLVGNVLVERGDDSDYDAYLYDTQTAGPVTPIAVSSGYQELGVSY